MKIQILEDDRFYDYHTKPVKGKEIFDVTKTGMSFYDEFVTNPSYMEKQKNLKAEIQYMTPLEYFYGCASIFNSTADKQLSQTGADKNTIEHLKAVINEYGKQFPVTILNFAQNTQEGRHRMYVAGELFGWQEKFPVMVIDFADKEKAKADEDRKNKEGIYNKLSSVSRNSLQYNFSSIEDFKDQLLWDADRVFEYDDYLRNGFKIYEDNKYITISTNGVELKISKNEIKIREDNQQDLDDVIPYDDITYDDVEKILNSI